ncbi:MAG: hypothetical protein ABSC45_12165 [Desulfobaccales bacterium]
MAKFQKGLNDEFIRLLNEAYNKGGWWRDLLNDSDLHIGIRNNYLNVYYQGNSLVLIRYDSKGLLGHTHYKYLLHPRKNRKPIISAEGNIENLKGVFIDHLDKENLELMKKASSVYAGEEKKGIQWILKSNPNIIDMEIALTQEAEKQEAEGIEEFEESGGPAAQRLDFAALQKITNGVELVFFEAKTFSNKELRAKEEKEPKVVKQIKKYQKLIEKYLVTGDIVESYRRVCENFVDLLGIPDEKKKIAQKVVQEGVSFNISTRPRLVIFGFDKDQKIGDVFKVHQKKLEQKEMLGKNRILLKGSPKDFTNGISFTSRNG